MTNQENHTIRILNWADPFTRNSTSDRFWYNRWFYVKATWLLDPPIWILRWIGSWVQNAPDNCPLLSLQTFLLHCTDVHSFSTALDWCPLFTTALYMWHCALLLAVQSAENRVHCNVMPAAMCRTVRGTVLHDIHCTWRCTVHYYWQCSVLATVLLQSGVGLVQCTLQCVALHYTALGTVVHTANKNCTAAIRCWPCGREGQGQGFNTGSWTERGRRFSRKK